MNALAPVVAALAPRGLNLHGVVPARAWDAVMAPARQTAALLPGATTIGVFANGGPGLWRAFLADLDADPRRLTDEANPFDAFVRRVVLAADAALGDAPRRWFWAAADAEVHVDFRVLAHLAGIGQASRLGLLLDDRFGPWIGLRAACFLVEPGVNVGDPLAPVTPAEPALSPRCEGCTRCADACPGVAFPAGRWAVDVCSTFHHLSDACASRCHAREACPVGADQRYDPDEIVYHYNRAAGREALRRRLGLAPGADRYDGIGPHWGDWRKRVDVKGG